MHTGPHNPFLANSDHAIAHGRCDQQDNTAGPGPVGPGRTLTEHDLQFTWLGPGHFGGLTSGPYPDGKRVIWTNGRHTVTKLDYDTLELLAELPISTEVRPTQEEMEAGVSGLDELEGDAAMGHAIELAMRFMTGLDGVYGLLDVQHTLFVGRSDCVVAYVESDPTDRRSPIVERSRWEPPAEVAGRFVGMNMTFDGRLVLSTDHGWVISLARDFSNHVACQLPGAEVAAAHCTRMEQERGHTGYGWVRTSLCVDDAGGIYVASNNHLHKVVWNGSALSTAATDGAWTAPYRNGNGTGSGTTPCLMGFGDEDRFVVIGDGDPVVNITLFWRDQIPEDWQQLSGAPSRRIAGFGPAHMGDTGRTAIQTEQSITVCGYGAMTVNNEPRNVPDGFPVRGQRLLAFFLGHKSAYTPYGLHKYEWNPTTRTLDQAWINTEVSSPNSVPFVSAASNLVYTCGTREGQWTIEALDWSTGEPAFHHVVGGSCFNTLGSAVTLDEDGRLLYGTIFGKARVP